MAWGIRTFNKLNVSILEIINLVKLEYNLIRRYIFIISAKCMKYYKNELKIEIVAMWEFSK